MKADEVIIIGAGPAGLAAAIQLKRYGIQPLIFERARAGGLLHNANLVENYPGFPSGISGPRLVALFTRQARNLDLHITQAEVTSLAFEQEHFQVTTAERSYTARLVVVASGTKPILLPDVLIPPGLAERVFYEVADLLSIEGRHILVIGSGDAAFDYALNLGRKNRVTILNRGTQTHCLPLLWERAQRVSNITYLERTRLCALEPHAQGGMLVDCQTAAGGLQFHADYLVAAIGRTARLDFMPGALQQQAGMLEAQGILYIIGDVKNGIFRQTSIAVGEGVLAAMKIYRKLKEQA